MTIGLVLSLAVYLSGSTSQLRLVGVNLINNEPLMKTISHSPGFWGFGVLGFWGLGWGDWESGLGISCDFWF